MLNRQGRPTAPAPPTATRDAETFTGNRGLAASRSR